MSLRANNVYYKGTKLFCQQLFLKNFRGVGWWAVFAFALESIQWFATSSAPTGHLSGVATGNPRFAPPEGKASGG